MVLHESRRCVVWAHVTGSGAGFMHLHMASSMWVGSSIAYGEVGVLCSEFRDGDDASKGGVMTMMPTCCLDETLPGVVSVGILCVPLNGCDGFRLVLDN